jgi:hypothetical protein
VRRVLPAFLVLAIAASAALADWLQPDPSYRDAQMLLRQAQRDTLDHGNEPARLDTLGVALLRLGRTEDARALFARVLAADPENAAARAALGKLALFADRLREADTLLGHAGREPDMVADLYALRMREEDYAGAARLAPMANEPGRAPILEWMASHPPYYVASGPEVASVPWNRGYPIPLVRVKLNGQSVLMGIDTGARDLILDQSIARVARVTVMPSKIPVFWEGTRIAVQNAVVQRLELGGVRIEELPAGVANLRQWSIRVNPQSEPVAGVIGLQLLRRFTPTLDYDKGVLELRRPGQSYPVGVDAQRVPFEIWGESELMVYGTIASGRRMAMIVQTGLPGCGVAAPASVFEEVGVKPGMLSRAVKGAGALLQGRPWVALNVPTVTVGGLVRDKVAGWSGALDDAELWRHGVRRDAILSHDFFKGQRVTIDWERHELVVEGKN